MLTNISYRK